MGIRSLFGNLREKIIGKNLKIVFPEGNDERVLRAAARLKFEGLIETQGQFIDKISRLTH